MAEKNDRINIILQGFPQDPAALSDEMELTQYRAEVEATIAAINHNVNDKSKVAS